MLKSMRIEDYMASNHPTIEADRDLFDAIDIMLTHGLSGITVVNEQDEPVGMLSELDCLRAVLKGVYHQEAMATVGEYMTTPCDTISLSDDIIAVAQDMIDRKRRRRPVVADGRLVGVVTCREILRAVKVWNAPSDSSKS